MKMIASDWQAARTRWEVSPPGWAAPQDRQRRSIGLRLIIESILVTGSGGFGRKADHFPSVVIPEEKRWMQRYQQLQQLQRQKKSKSEERGVSSSGSGRCETWNVKSGSEDRAVEGREWHVSPVG